MLFIDINVICSVPRAPRADGAAPRARRERKPVDPATLDPKRVFIGYLPEGLCFIHYLIVHVITYKRIIIHHD